MNVNENIIGVMIKTRSKGETIEYRFRKGRKRRMMDGEGRETD